MIRNTVLWIVLMTFATPAYAACCRLVKVDAETPPSTVRACDPAGGNPVCGGVLFVGTLAIGESQEVCAAGPMIVYSEYDDAAEEFGPYVEAICSGDVEL